MKKQTIREFLRHQGQIGYRYDLVYIVQGKMITIYSGSELIAGKTIASTREICTHRECENTICFVVY